MTIDGIRGIGGGGHDWNRPPSGPPPSGGGGGDNNRKKIGEAKTPDQETTIEPKDVLELSSADLQIAEIEAMTWATLSTIAPETFIRISAEQAVMTNPALQARIFEMQQKARIAAGARAYQQLGSQYPLPVQPIAPIAPVNPNPLPNPEIPEKEGDDEKKEHSDKTPTA